MTRESSGNYERARHEKARERKRNERRTAGSCALQRTLRNFGLKEILQEYVYFDLGRSFQRLLNNVR